MEIKQHRRARARRHHPGDQSLAIGRGDAGLLGSDQSGRDDVGSHRIARKHELALPHVERAEHCKIDHKAQQQHQFQQTQDHGADGFRKRKGRRSSRPFAAIR